MIQFCYSRLYIRGIETVSAVCQDSTDGDGLKIEKLEPNFSSFTSMPAKNKKKKCIMVSNP